MRLRRPQTSEDFDAWAPFGLAVFFAWGSLLAMMVAVLPGREMPPLSGAIAIAGMFTAVGVVVLASKLTLAWLNLLLLGGSVCVALGVTTAVTTTGPDSVLFVWVGLFAGFFLGPKRTAVHVVAVGLLYGELLWGWPGAPTSVADTIQGWVLVVGSVAAAGVASLVLRNVADQLVGRHRTVASTDALTGLANRPELLRRGEERLDRPGAWAMLLIDLDDFKTINDIHGHDAGDRLLEEVADRIVSVVREQDLVARLGGDEFAVLVETTGDGGERVAERVHRALASPVHGMPIQASVGVVSVANGARSIAHVLRDADIAMYAAKREHGGWRSYTPEMHADVVQRRELQRDLEDGLDDQLHLAFQPIVAAATGEPVLVEALARWTHPRLGNVSPAEFIPIAESSGLIFPLGRRVLQEACRQAARWPELTGTAPVVSVNIAPPQLLQPGLVETVHRTLAQSGLPPERLMLEVTETSVMTDPERAGKRLRELRDLGVRLAIDDFGTGHSSLAYLQRLPVTDLKLAREFVCAIGDSPRDLALARGVIALGHALGLRVVAEGVEEDDQRERLRDLGCDLLQGFLFARPMDETALIGHLAPARAAA